MSASHATGSAKGTSLSAAIEPYRTRLFDDALRFSDALLVLAKHARRNHDLQPLVRRRDRQVRALDAAAAIEFE